MSELTTAIVSILTAVIGVAMLATLVSRNANTVGVIQAGSSGFSNILGTALSPVTGSSSGFAANNNSFNLNTGGLF